MTARGPHRYPAGVAVIAICAAVVAALASPTRAPAASLLSPVCSIVSHAPAPLGLGCKTASRTLDAGRQLASGNVGGAAAGVLGGAANGVASLALGAIGSWAAGSAKFALDETARLIDTTTAPRLQAPWFERVYWRMAGISVLLTLPFLFAAAAQSVLRSDLALLTRAAFGYLPCAMLAVGVCAQVTALLLAATDGLCDLVSGVAGNTAPTFLARAGAAIVGLSVRSNSPFLAFVVAVFTVAGAVMLWLELMMRDAAVYVVVAMLPLAFAAFVWPARRVWALRAVELLAALILAKLAIVVVLTLGGAALSQSPTVAGFLVGLVLLVLGVFAPWAMLRMLPLTELAGGSAGRLRAESSAFAIPETLTSDAGRLAHGAAEAALERLRPPTEPGSGGPGPAAQRESGGPQVAAEAMAARTADDDQGGGSSEGTGPTDSADGFESANELAIPSSGEDQDRAGSAEVIGQPPTSTLDSILAAPDQSLRALELDLEAPWRDPREWPGTEAAQAGTDQANAAADIAPAPASEAPRDSLELRSDATGPELLPADPESGPGGDGTEPRRGTEDDDR
jgi:hypothetical protein